MKLHHKTLYINGALVFVFGILGLISSGAFGLGLVLLLVAALNLLFLLAGLVRKNNLAARTAILCFGVLLLIGFSVCTQANFNVR